MKVRKLVLGEMPKCYSVCPVTLDGEELLLFGSEEEIPWRLYSEKRPGEYREVEGSCGGTMGFVTVPGKKEEFLAVQHFHSTVRSDKAELVWVKWNHGKPQLTVAAKLPHLHRFDIIPAADGLYVIACTPVLFEK